MTEQHTIQGEDLSAWMDGELQGGTSHQAILADVLGDTQARTAWHAYHVIGDVLRSEELSGSGQDLQFLAKLEARLAQEPLRPTAMAVAPNSIALFSGRYLQSVNNSGFRRLLAGVACSALVAVVGLSVWSPATTPASVSIAALPPLATTTNPAQSVPVDIAVGPDGMIRDARLDQLLSAHQQLGGHSALQMPSGFLRNATYERASR